MRKLLTFLILLTTVSFSSMAQHFTHDIGFHAGTATIQTDYGIRNNFLSSYGNSAPSISFTHTLHFFNRDPRWNSEHPFWSFVALRTELNFINDASVEHHGRFVESNTDLGRELRAMTGSMNITNIGIQLEYYMKCLRDFVYPYSDIKINPYLSAGVQYTRFKNTLNSTLGDWTQDITVLPDKWTVPGAVDIGPGNTFAVTFGGGTRYNLSKNIDLNLQFNWQFFFSDSVDGLRANVIENKNNEWLLNLQLGVIYNLNFDRPLFNGKGRNRVRKRLFNLF